MINTSNTKHSKPLASKSCLRVRAQLYAQIREYFAQQNVLEVDTPIINQYAVSDLHIDSIQAQVNKQVFYLHTSPEYSMKQLLVQFECDIYQLCKVFRAEEAGVNHHPEFTMLEWYRIGWDYHELMQEVDKLCKILLQDKLSLDAPEFISYSEAFKKYCDIDIAHAKDSEYLHACESINANIHSKLSRQDAQEFLLDQVIAKKFSKDCLTFIYDFPKQQAALARITAQGFAQRFEMYLGDMELANGYQELTDAKEQLQRFEQDNEKRSQHGKRTIEIDQKFIAALEQGMPETSGVALGVDRLLMILLQVKDIKQTLTFSKF